MTEIKEYDKNNNLIHFRDTTGYESWYEYDKNNNVIHCRYSTGYESWYEYDTNNNVIHGRDSYGYEDWYDENGHGELWRWSKEPPSSGVFYFPYNGI